MKKFALLFPGQGSQYIGMGKSFINDFKVAAELFEEANEVLNFDLKRLILKGDMAELTHSANAQPAVITVSYAMFKVHMQEIGIKPHYSAGHSLGEISALIAAGGIRFSDGVRFARQRGTLMHQAYTQKIGNVALILGLSEEVVQEEVDKVSETIGYVSITGYNSPIQILAAGEKVAILELGKRINNLKGEFVPFSLLPMKADAPYHSALMSFLEEKIKAELKLYTFSPLQWDVISNITARPYESHKEIKKNLSLQLVNPVKWSQTLSYLEKQDVTIVLDIGPQYVLKTLVTENNNTMKSFSFDIKEDRIQLKKELGLEQE